MEARMSAYETARRIRDALSDIVELYDEVLEPQRPTSGIRLPTVQVQGEKSFRYAGRVMRHSPPPISAAILDARRACHEELLYYARVVLMTCVDVNGNTITTRVDHESIPALCDFLDTWALILAGAWAQEAEACARRRTRSGGTGSPSASVPAKWSTQKVGAARAARRCEPMATG